MSSFGEAAAEVMGCNPGDVTFEDGWAEAGGQRMDYGAVVRAFFAMPGGEFIGRGYVRAGDGIPAQFPVFWETGMGAASVTVDEETGELRVPHYASVADVGKAINRLQAEAQDEGAAIMGLGHTLCENLLYDNGQPLNPNLIDYKVPAFTDMPRRFEVAHWWKTPTAPVPGAPRAWASPALSRWRRPWPTPSPGPRG